MRNPDQVIEDDQMRRVAPKESSMIITFKDGRRPFVAVRNITEDGIDATLALIEDVLTDEKLPLDLDVGFSDDNVHFSTQGAMRVDRRPEDGVLTLTGLVLGDPEVCVSIVKGLSR